MTEHPRIQVRIVKQSAQTPSARYRSRDAQLVRKGLPHIFSEKSRRPSACTETLSVFSCIGLRLLRISHSWWFGQGVTR